jgi:hypothetical protein
MIADMPKTYGDLKYWVCLGRTKKSTWQKFSVLTKTTPADCLSEWEMHVQEGNIILERVTRTAWIRRSVCVDRTDNIKKEAEKVYDFLTSTQLEDIEQLVRDGYTVSDALRELNISEFETRTTYDELENELPKYFNSPVRGMSRFYGEQKNNGKKRREWNLVPLKNNYTKESREYGD